MVKAVFLFSALASLGVARQCKNLTIPLSLSARNGIFNLEAPASNIAITDFILDLAREGHNLTQELLTGYATISGDYSIVATLCHPDSGPSSIVQVLTHGIGFDRSYWDFSYGNYNYSYVNQALAKGYSTFFWDRLGIGASSHGDPVNEIQAWLQVSALYALTVMLKNGSLPGAEGTKFPKAIHVGHSFGSLQTYTLTVLHPDASDGIILTGFSHATSFVPQFGLGSNFIQANSVPALSAFPTGYFAAASTVGVQIDFFSPGQFDPNVLTAAFATGQPVAPGEILTLGGAASQVNPIKGPVLIITGARDTPFCGGDCLRTGNASLPTILDASKPFFPNSSNLENFIVPGAGHGLNLEYSWPTTYGTVLAFLAANGLSA